MQKATDWVIDNDDSEYSNKFDLLVFKFVWTPLILAGGKQYYMSSQVSFIYIAQKQ